MWWLYSLSWCAISLRILGLLRIPLVEQQNSMFKMPTDGGAAIIKWCRRPGIVCQSKLQAPESLGNAYRYDAFINWIIAFWGLIILRISFPPDYQQVLFYGTISLDTPAQSFVIDFDTGSADLWVLSAKSSSAASIQVNTKQTNVIINSKFYFNAWSVLNNDYDCRFVSPSLLRETFKTSRATHCGFLVTASLATITASTTTVTNKSDSPPRPLKPFSCFGLLRR